MKQTTNYKLKKIELMDSPPDITVHSGNFDIIDEEMKRLSEQSNEIATLKANKLQEIWQTTSLLNGWVDFGAAFDGIGFYKDDMGILHLKGLIKGGVVTGGTALFYLPSGYRPSKTKMAPIISNSGTSLSTKIGTIEINADGKVSLGAEVGNTWLLLEGISFRI